MLKFIEDIWIEATACNKNVWELPGGGTSLQIEKKQKIWTVLETTNWITSVNDLT